MPDASQPTTKRQLPDGPPYRVAPGGFDRDEWVVASGTPDNPGPAIASGYKTREAAQAAATEFNRLQLDEGQTDEVLGRMLHSKP